MRDDERDADGDGLANWLERRGRMTEAWWQARHDGTTSPGVEVPGASTSSTTRTRRRHSTPLPIRDVDGDGVLDGEDDQDNDGLTNIREPSGRLVVTRLFDTANPWAYVNPFIPCKPFNSERCHSHPPFGSLLGRQPPPIRPDPPAGYPDVQPVTPHG